MNRRNSFLILCIFLALAPAAPAQAGLVEFFFPSLRKKGPDPLDTLQAPFALDPNAPAPTTKPDPTKVALPENKTPIDQPHRDNEEISTWLTSVLSESLTFQTDNYQAELAKNSQFFTPGGREQYVGFLTDKNIIKVLDGKTYQVRSFVESTPLLLNEGTVNGVYRWLYEVPIMLSYLPRGNFDYKKVESVNQKIVLTVQVGRTPGQLSGMGILIERWDARDQKAPKKK